MGQTRYYNLAFFDFGDRLDARVNVQKEIDRFVVIDKQMYGLYRVFGNGVIDGWNVRDAGFQEGKGITISVDTGMGVINYLACETSMPGYLYSLPPNSLVDVYVSVSGATSIDRTVSFMYSSTDIRADDNIRIARVSTGSNSILYIDNNIRDLIGFDEIIQDAIEAHKHRGTPSKIDLSTETRNQLPGARIEGIDASKIASGRFNQNRLPAIDHNDLENNGLLSHAALDSFVKTLSQNNKELLGEISSVNLMKSIVFLKYRYPDVDEHFINELSLIPGISPDSFIDFDASTASVNVIDHCISGIPAKSGVFASVYWNDSISFNLATVKDHVVIEDDTVSIDRSSQVVETIADFSDGIMSFTPETVIIEDDVKASIAVEDGNRIGRLGGAGASVNYFYRKNFATGKHKSWDGVYDEIAIKVKTSEQIHSPVYFYVVNGDNLTSSGEFGSIESDNISGIKAPSSSWVLLAQDEYMSSFQEKVFSISGLSLTDVSQIAIYSSDDFAFDIDDILVRRTNLVSQTGTIRFRYQTEADVIFHSIFYESSVPQDTSLSVRVKTASTSDLLSRSSSSLPLASGSVFALSGSACEIEVTMTSDNNRVLSPTLSSVELRMLVTADFTGFVIDTETEWERGSLSNVSTNDSAEVGKSYLTVSTPINIGGAFFSKSGSVSEIDNYSQAVEEHGFSGNLMPISPNQARNWSSSSNRGFDVISSVFRKYNKNFLVADLNNNRVFEIDYAGNMVRGFGSTYATDTDFYPLSSVYSHTTKNLSIVFTKASVVSDITKICFYYGSSKISLTSDSIILNNNKSGGKVLEIHIDDDTALRLTGATSDDLSVNFDGGAFTETIKVNSGMTSSGNSIFSALKGIICFVGEFVYIDNIIHPVFFNELSSGNWIIANSSVFYKKDENSDEATAVVPGIIEIDPEDELNNDGKLTSNDIKFSDYTLGSIYEYDTDRFVVAGIESISTSVSSITGDDLIADNGGEDNVSEGILFRASAIDDLKKYAGKVVVIDKVNNKKQIFYSSPDGLYPSCVDGYSNGDLLVSESSFVDASGRLIKLDGYGNVIWNYGSGTFNVINDANIVNDDSIMISV